MSVQIGNFLGDIYETVTKPYPHTLCCLNFGISRALFDREIPAALHRFEMIIQIIY